MGVQYKQNRQWILYAKYDGKGYTKSKPVTYSKSDGTTGTQMQTVWTLKGREFIHSILGH
jgi:phage antirepressor YoqD-like protein